MHNASLVIFTLCIQISVGILAATRIHIWSGKGLATPVSFTVISTCLGLIIVGLISAVAHLGNPKNAPHALSNITRSWLSREISAVNLLAGGTGLLWILTWLEFLKGMVFIEIVTLIFGIAAIWTMSQVYMLKTVPMWNHRSTPIDFFGTSLLSGGITSALLDHIVSCPDTEQGIIFLLFSCLGFICKIATVSYTLSNQEQTQNQFWYADSRKKNSRKMVTYLTLLSLYALGLILFAIGYMGIPCQPLIYLIPSFLLILLAEIRHRFRFYDSFCRLGL